MNNDGWEKAERGPAWTATRDNPLTISIGTNSFRLWAEHNQAKGVAWWTVEYGGREDSLRAADPDDTVPELRRDLALWWAEQQ